VATLTNGISVRRCDFYRPALRLVFSRPPHLSYHVMLSSNIRDCWRFLD